MATTLGEDLLRAFRSADREAAQDALARVVNRAARLMAEGNRQRLTEFWKGLTRTHYDAEALELPADFREQRGYLEAIVHLSKAVRDQSDDVEAIQKVKKCVHGPAILAALKKEGTIRHGELAERLGISAPSLTQAMRTLADSRAITSTVHGKFKYYSLTPVGQLVATKLGKTASLQKSIADMREALPNIPDIWAWVTQRKTAELLSKLVVISHYPNDFEAEMPGAGARGTEPERLAWRGPRDRDVVSEVLGPREQRWGAAPAAPEGGESRVCHSRQRRRSAGVSPVQDWWEMATD